MPFIVYGFSLLCRGMIIFLLPLVMPICLPSLDIQKPPFSKAFTARCEEMSVKSMNYANTTSTSLSSAPFSSSRSISK